MPVVRRRFTREPAEPRKGEPRISEARPRRPTGPPRTRGTRVRGARSGDYVHCLDAAQEREVARWGERLHEERMPSCMVWPDECGWWCFGCGRGGGIYDLASLLAGGAWGRALNGALFISARDPLRERLRTPAAGRGRADL